MQITKNFRLVVKPYKSDNHLGYNAIVQCLENRSGKGKVMGLLYVSFDHTSPRFLWERAENIAPGAREYLELKAQEQSEKEIKSLLNL